MQRFLYMYLPMVLVTPHLPAILAHCVALTAVHNRCFVRSGSSARQLRRPRSITSVHSPTTSL